jgi:hypothetical protein
MKKMNFKYIAAFTVFICVSAGHAADTPVGTAEAIGAELNTTRAAIDQVVRQMGERSRPAQYNVKDYKAWSPVFRHNIEQGLLGFEAAMKNSVTKKLSFWMDRYNQIYLSPEFSADQKKILLAKQMDIIKSQLIDIEKEYHAEIFKVYQLAGNLPYDYQLTHYYLDSKNPSKEVKQIYKEYRLVDKNKEHDIKSRRGFYVLDVVRLQGGVERSARAQNDFIPGISFADHLEKFINMSGNSYPSQCRGREDFPENDYSKAPMPFSLLANSDPYCNDGYERAKIAKSDITTMYIQSSKVYFPVSVKKYREIVFPQVFGDCKSELCVGLKSADINFFVTLTSTTIDRNIELKLLDGKSMNIKKLDFNTGIIEWFLTQIDYPVSLPFDTEP